MFKNMENWYYPSDYRNEELNKSFIETFFKVYRGKNAYIYFFKEEEDRQNLKNLKIINDIIANDEYDVSYFYKMFETDNSSYFDILLPCIFQISIEKDDEEEKNDKKNEILLTSNVIRDGRKEIILKFTNYEGIKVNILKNDIDRDYWSFRSNIISFIRTQINSFFLEKTIDIDEDFYTIANLTGEKHDYRFLLDTELKDKNITIKKIKIQ